MHPTQTQYFLFPNWIVTAAIVLGLVVLCTIAVGEQQAAR